MIFYLAQDENAHPRLCKTQAEAKAISKDFEQIDIPVDKNGLHATVQEFYNELYKLQQDTLGSTTNQQQAENPVPEPGPIIVNRDLQLETREQFEKAWENFPLALQLDFAAMALNDARDQIKPRKDQ